VPPVISRSRIFEQQEGIPVSVAPSSLTLLVRHSLKRFLDNFGSSWMIKEVMVVIRHPFECHFQMKIPAFVLGTIVEHRFLKPKVLGHSFGVRHWRSRAHRFFRSTPVPPRSRLMFSTHFFRLQRIVVLYVVKCYTESLHCHIMINYWFSLNFPCNVRDSRSDLLIGRVCLSHTDLESENQANINT
jgi:hypothetical protein